MCGMLMTAVLVIYASTAIASPLTCAAFEDRLVSVIHDGGDKVATPKNFHVIQKDELPRILYGFEGIVGVQGDLDCALDDQFRIFSFKTILDGSSDGSTALGITRAVALIGASICATDPADVASCSARASGLVRKAVDALKAAHDRGEPYPGADENLDVSLPTRARLTVLPGELLFELETNLERTPDDLN